jgi:DNA repair protein RecO (recombination protein O)
MPIITQAETLDSSPGGPRKPCRGRLRPSCGRAARPVHFTNSGENQALYYLLTETLAPGERSRPAIAVRYYEIRLLDLLGFRPQLFHCAVCGNEIQAEDQYFSAEDGGALCPTCGRGRPGAMPISMAALKYFRHFQRSLYGEAKRAQLSPGVSREMEILMQHYLTYMLERGLNTPAFLRRVRRETQAEPGDEGNRG